MLAAVLAARLLMELALLVVIGWWGVTQAAGVAGVLLAAALVVVAAGVWGLVVSPRARLAVSPGLRVATELVLVLLGSAALADLGHPWWGAALLVVDVAVIVALATIGRRAGVGWSPHDVQQGLVPRRPPSGRETR